MRGYVFTDAALAPLADHFVWLAVDTEKASNAPVVARFPVNVWPTFFVVDPADESVQGRWLGAASVAQLRAFLLDSERAVQLAHTGALPPGDPLARLLAAHREAVAKRWPEAAARYSEAIAAAPPDWPHRPEALVARIEALYRAKDDSACVALGLASMGETGRAASATDFANFALSCAGHLPKTDARVFELRRAAAARLAELASDPAAALSADDRSDAYLNLHDALEAIGDVAGARAAAEKRLAVLNAAQATAPDAYTASTFDWAYAESCLFLGRGEEAIPMLEAHEKALPDEYNPPHFLARLLHLMKRDADALAPMDRALAKAYGPRRAAIMGLKADILEGLGRLADARAVLAEQVAAWEALPAPQRKEESLARARERLAALDAKLVKK